MQASYLKGVLKRKTTLNDYENFRGIRSLWKTTSGEVGE